MFSVSVREDFITQHFLPQETGRESAPHSHHYFVEVCVVGETLDTQGFLVDIVDLKHQLRCQLEPLCDRLLNELDEFRKIPPTLENLARLLWVRLASQLNRVNVSSMKVTVWEEEHISASFEGELRSRS